MDEIQSTLPNGSTSDTSFEADEQDEQSGNAEAFRSSHQLWLPMGLYVEMIGTILIVVGLVDLLQYMGFTAGFENGWALLLVLPTASMFALAGSIYRKQQNQWSASMLGPLVGGVICALLTLIFLFDIDLQLFLPLILIGGGISVVVCGSWIYQGQG